MTVGRPAGAPGDSEWSRQVFPPKSSSDSEAEEEFSADRLPLPRAGRLAEFLGSEEETGSTWDSSESLREKPQVLGHEGRCRLLESLFPSDPDSDEHPSEDDEDLDGFLQDQGKDQQPVVQPLSPRYGTTRRCSSLGSLPLDRASTSSQLQPAQGSRPPSQHRSISAWASSITVPRPFRMTLREARKKAQRLASPTSFEQGRRQGQEEAECQRQFRAQPVPAHVYLPLYQELVARSEARRQAGIQERKELLLSSLKPFSFLQKEEQRKEAARHQDTAATAKAKATKQKAARRIPKSILEPALGDKLQEAELLRKIRIQMRALDTLQMASSPIPAPSSGAEPRPRTAARTQERKLAFLQADFGFQPRVNPSVPDYEGLYRAFQRRAARGWQSREATRSQPFSLRTANLRHSQRPCATATSAATAGKRDSPRPPATPLPRSRSLSGLAALSANTLPVHITDATRKRELAVRNSLEKKDRADEGLQWLEMHKKNCQAMSKSVTLRAKAMDPHRSLEEVFKAKLKENRNNDRKRTKEYKRELEEMKRRIQTRPYLFEQVTKNIARKAAEQRYQDALKQVGLEEDFVKNKGQDCKMVQGEEVHAKELPSTHEITELGTREPQQDPEDSPGWPTHPQEELEGLNYEYPDNLKPLA
ncbi:protein FAM161B isoform X1 [Ochotona curzoniae]|uniref:protein FAM161B isoform X1 n=1 Tax=Ochotona curzoniae TaxID=130825 RepID=UPI001B34C114|nr:protein FAM161B isoform X1 [Ochotona curzoniae]